MSVSDLTMTNQILPVEILEPIFAYAGYPSTIELVCKNWLGIARDSKATFALLKEKKIQFGIEGAIQGDKQADIEKIVKDIQEIFIGRLSSFFLEERMTFFKTLPPTTITLLRLHDLGQDLNLLKCFPVIEKQAGLVEPQKVESEASVAQQAHRVREILKNNQVLLQTITSLDLNKLGLTVVPEELNLLRGVKSVKLAFNSIRMIPVDFGRAWTKLTELHLNNSQIERLPEGFGQVWEELQTVYLFDNKVPSLPANFGSQWKKVRSVFLQLNKITSLEPGFGDSWVNVQGVKLSNNLLDQLPDNFGCNWHFLQHFEACKNHSEIKVAQLKKQWPKIVICK